MNTTNSVSFKGFDFRNVIMKDRVYIRNDFTKLLELGKKYDITLTSTYIDVPDFAAIDINVRPLKKDVSFFKKLFRPVSKKTFQIGDRENDMSANPSVLKFVEDAITNLNNKLYK